MIEFKKEPDKEDDIFERLHPLVKEWFRKKFKAFSLPQLYGILEIHSRNNILVSASTGSGKTITCFLSILNELIDSSEKGILQDKIYCVYVSPLKSLNNDIFVNLQQPLKEIEELAGKRLGIRVAVRTGDTTQAERQKMAKHVPHILITTPESLAILLSSTKFKDNLMDVQWGVIDELHALAENKRGVHLSLSMERLQRLSPGMARVGLSATVSPLEEVAHFLVGSNRNCKVVEVPFIKELDMTVLSPVPDLIEASFQSMHSKMYSLLHELIQKHKTTLIFTNTRSATERVVHNLMEKYPKMYMENIGAHHGSLSRHHRLELEQAMRDGKLKVCVSSTSLELGIDIGYIDLVLLLGSPKSVARAKQRMGRAGHKLHDTILGRIIVLDRDDLVECSVLLKDVIEHKIDRMHIPTNCLDVLAQQIFGIAIAEIIHDEELYALIKGSYCYRDLSRRDFNDVLDYLSGRFISLEDRYIYAKIWHDEETRMIGRKGKMARVLYMTNIGTIPDESHINVKVGDMVIGAIDEAFLERLRPGDVFVLGGRVYKFKFSRGMVAQVEASPTRPPTVPSWFSDMLPLSFDLAMDIQRFRRLMEQKFTADQSKAEVIEFINHFLYLDKNAASSIYNFFKEQYDYLEIPSDKKLIIEHYIDDSGQKHTVFHSLFGRRVNDALARAVAYAISRSQHKDVYLGVTDNGFYVSSDKKINIMQAFKLLKSADLRKVLELAIENSEILKRRFRHCATRALMILRSYKGKTKRVGRQQVSSMILMNAVKRISPDFFILRESRREVLDDLMDVGNAANILEKVEKSEIKVKEFETRIPSPFALNIVASGQTDIMKMEDKQEFLMKMHRLVLAKIGLKKR